MPTTLPGIGRFKTLTTISPRKRKPKIIANPLYMVHQDKLRGGI
ncbi:hypothetical protein TERMP_01974 [Thermococcus barophilus MP]|uniref:Uncharacterized protein n=1 Tax=Thermococcus barophilus (strain DSM 11836 / MP) TaxID=391623 RepID=F0LL41_THEBM|nr:hypothetical protein TERMP_01974 [Thermococcus barophilus MP]